MISDDRRAISIFSRGELIIAILLLLVCSGSAIASRVAVKVSSQAPPVVWGASRLRSALVEAGYAVNAVASSTVAASVAKKGVLGGKAGKPEGYRITANGKNIQITGCDGPGAMYGCLELARRVKEAGKLPEKLDISDGPALNLRGSCILLEKAGVYDYPVTPKEFPWFYDKKQWTQYLDFLAENRYNYIAFWNGHPFDYFVKLDKYPEAQSGMGDALIKKNHDLLMWLGVEAQKRNIWLMFQFYNIHVSVYFAKAHNLPDHGISEPTPLLRDYTAYCIERFVSEFPSIGLYICPGECLGQAHKVDWINNVIFPAIKRTGKTPPVMIRAWSIELDQMKQVAHGYPRLYTERKYNIEVLGGRQIDKRNADWAKVTGNHVVNMHEMADIVPFRWGSPSYVQDCVRSSIKDGGATGLHLYCRGSWRWPRSFDISDNPQMQWERDWLWFETWARYAWNPDLDSAKERDYWLGRLTRQYGNKKAAEHILNSFDVQADVMPGIQRVVMYDAGNHNAIASGMLLEQFLQPIKFLTPEDFVLVHPISGVMRVFEYANALKKGETPVGMSPVEFLSKRVADAELALKEAELGAKAATRNKEEAERVLTDQQAIVYIVRFYRDKAKAAIAKSLFDAGIDRQKNRDECLNNLNASIEHWCRLVDLTRETYECITDCPAWFPPTGHNYNMDWNGMPRSSFHWMDFMPIYNLELTFIERELSAAMNESKS